MLSRRICRVSSSALVVGSRDGVLRHEAFTVPCRLVLGKALGGGIIGSLTNG